MVSLPLFARGMKGSLKLLIIFGLLMNLYVGIIVWMYEPGMYDALLEFEQVMPGIMAALGMLHDQTGLLSFVAAYLYGFITLVVPMAYTILTANRLVAKQVDGGAMAFLLAAPVRRRKLVTTQALVLVLGIVLLVASATGMGLAVSAGFFPGELDVPAFWWLNGGLLALQLFIGGLCFFASCLFNDTKYSLALGAGLPCVCYIVQMAANFGGDLEVLKYGTFFTLFDTDGLIAMDPAALWKAGILLAAALLLFILSGVVFCKKDMPV